MSTNPVLDISPLDILSAGEGFHAEFKTSVDKTLVEDVCAFANSRGGKIYLGVNDLGEIVGVDTSSRNVSRIQDILRHVEPQVDFTISINDGLIILSVSEGSEKPYGCPRGFFVRMGANSQKLTRHQILEYFQREGRFRFDELRHPTATFPEHVDEASVARFVSYSGIKAGHDTEGLLRNLDCMTADFHLTNTGVLFFVTSIDFLMNHAVVTCVLYRGEDKVYILDKKDFDRCMIDNIEDVLRFIERHTATELVIESARRREVSAYPTVALREAVINAFCHRDYFDKHSRILIEIFSNRIEISNPGGLPSGLSRKDFGTRSVARNPLIASMLQRARFIERLGTGIRRM